MMDFDSHPASGIGRIPGHGFGLGKTWAGSKYSSLPDKFSDDDTALKQPRTWAGPVPMSTLTGHMDDVEPSGKAPAPSSFSASDFVRRMEPDPLLTVTPEKSIGLSRIGNACDLELDENNSGILRTEQSDEGKKSKHRVRFAPGTRTSPSQTSVGGDVPSKFDGRTSVDDDSVPRSFAAVSERLYQPGRYADSDGEGEPSPGTNAPSSGAKAPQPQDNKTVYVPVHDRARNLDTYTHSNKPTTAKVVKHLPKSSSKVKKREEQELSALDTEVKNAFQNTGYSLQKKTKSDGRSRSTSPYEIQSQRVTRSGSTSPKASRKSPTARSSSTLPSRPSSAELFRLQSLFEGEREKPPPAVTVVREAPRRPPAHDYLFPFSTEEMRAGGDYEYDQEFEHPFARPEFNSTLKISEDLRSVKERRPDTWGVVSKTLQTSNKKRTEIQEKASARVNVETKSDLFSGLVDIDVPLDDIRQNIEREKTLQAPPSKPPPVKVPIGKEPDIMEFFPLDLQRELPDLTLTGIQPVTESLITANPILAFDLYRHNRAWNGVADS